MKKFLSLIITVMMCLSLISIVACNSSGSNSYTCNVCHRKFSGGTSDSKSIIRTNMCVQCYNNYKHVTGK